MMSLFIIVRGNTLTHYCENYSINEMSRHSKRLFSIGKNYAIESIFYAFHIQFQTGTFQKVFRQLLSNIIIIIKNPSIHNRFSESCKNWRSTIETKLFRGVVCICMAQLFLGNIILTGKQWALLVCAIAIALSKEFAALAQYFLPVI